MSDNRERAKTDPDLPLADRLVNATIGKWLDTKLGLAEAAVGEDSPLIAGLERARDALSGHWYQLTPRILDELRRAGLLHEELGPCPEES